MKTGFQINSHPIYYLDGLALDCGLELLIKKILNVKYVQKIKQTHIFKHLFYHF